MQATKTVKKQTKWQAFWKRLSPRIPFWKQRPEDRVDHSSERGGSFLDDVVNIVMVVPVSAVVIAFLLQFIIGPIFLSPDFLTYGLADPIGRGLAGVCAATGNCNVQYLLAGSVVAVLIFTMILVIILSPSSAEVVDDNDTIDAVLDATAALDERIVHLRAEMVLAGLLPLTADEKADADDAG